MKKNLPSVLAVSLLSLHACAPLSQEELDEELELDGTQQAINRGTLITSNENPHDAVVLISGAHSDCTATKISATRFLTAAHCFDDMPLTVGASVMVTNHPEGHSAPSAERHRLTVTQSAQHPFYKHSHNSMMNIDLAWFEVSATPVANIPVRPVSDDFLADWTTGRAVGYGLDDFSAHGGLKQQATMQSRPLLDYYNGHTGWSLGLATVEYTTNIISGGSGVNAGARGNHGDSGGPWLVFNTANNRWEIAGVFSYTYSDEPYSFSARSTNFFEWLQDSRTNVFESGSYGSFYNAYSHQCLVADTNALGSPVYQAYCDARTAQRQRWQILVQGSYFQIRNKQSLLCLNLSNTSTGAVSLAYCQSGVTTQQWSFPQPASGFRTIMNRATATCLGNNRSHSRTTKMTTYTCDKLSLDERWIFSR